MNRRKFIVGVAAWPLGPGWLDSRIWQPPRQFWVGQGARATRIPRGDPGLPGIHGRTVFGYEFWWQGKRWAGCYGVAPTDSLKMQHAMFGALQMSCRSTYWRARHVYWHAHGGVA